MRYHVYYRKDLERSNVWQSPQEVLDELPKHPYDLYLLLDIDLPWQDDPLRDFPHMREHFMDVWHKELKP
jgi:nicotinamide riboside kinase